MKATSGESASVVRWPPAPSAGGTIGLVAVIFCAFAAIVSVLSLRVDTIVSLPSWLALTLFVIFLTLAAGFGYLLYGYATIRYELTADQLTIRWAGRRHDIPFETVQQIVPALERLDPNPPGWRRFWPGYYVGEQATLAGLVTIVATLGSRRQLLLVTRDYQYAISPERPVLFLEAFAQLRGSLKDDSPESAAGWQPAMLISRFVDAGWTTPYPTSTAESRSDAARDLAGQPPDMTRSAVMSRLWSDAVSTSLLSAALVLDVAITLFLLVRFDSLPQTLAIHWNGGGVADRFGPTRQIWTIPLVTWLITIANVSFAWIVDRFDRFAARMLLAASLAVELSALIALYWMIH